ncbi:MAG: SDR family oxidoreductase, partial [Gemmatimonadales bacterium]
DLRTVATELAELGAQVAFFAGDIADMDVVKQLAATAILEFGRIDTWVNNAGVSIYGLLEEVSIADARRLFDTNYWGMVNGSLIALKHLKDTGGALINVGSELSETVIPLQGHYNASKHALKGFTETLRIELEREMAPVSVTLVEPSAIDTPYPEHAKNYMDVEPTHQPPVYAPEIVANAILHCASHPHRTVRIGAGAKAFTLIEKVAPALGDRIKLASTFEGSRTSEPARDEDTLFHARPGDPRVRGRYRGHVMKQSWSTAATLRPIPAILAVATLGAGIAYAIRSRRNN